MENHLIHKEILEHFPLDGTYIYGEPFGCGHINSTFAIYFRRETQPPIRYILQAINTSIFQNPDHLMENIKGVTGHLSRKIQTQGGNPRRETLTIVPAKDGALYYKDAEETCWRVYEFIEDAVSYQAVERPILFYNAAKAFGKFQKQLADYPAETLHETIPRFHDTVDRFRQFQEAVKQDKAGRASSVEKEIGFVNAREKDCAIVLDLLHSGKMPLRVTHNDTKLNNIMMDLETDEGICVIDLDTVMPGSALYDFGDSIRFGASTAAEDETDLSKVEMSLDLFEQYVKGYLGEASLTPCELEYLAFSAKLMTLECGIRFLTDYLNGDTYFKIHRPGHNLDRCRTQFKLVSDMERKMDRMNQIVKEHS